jgi:hypothetical protein
VKLLPARLTALLVPGEGSAAAKAAKAGALFVKPRLLPDLAAPLEVAQSGPVMGVLVSEGDEPLTRVITTVDAGLDMRLECCTSLGALSC